ncbi:MAG: hypothetical protein R3B89_00990 [Polyangiaceae bacterium]
MSCGGASIEGGEVRPFDDAGMRLVASFDVGTCNPDTHPATTRIDVWSASGGARMLVSRGPSRQDLVVDRRFVVHGEERFEVVMEPSGGEAILQRFRLGRAPSLELIRDADAADDAPARGGTLVQRCALKSTASR